MTTEVQNFEYWTDKLNENKAKYKANEIPKDEYQKNGRRIRAKRRKAGAFTAQVESDSGAAVTNTPPVPKKPKSRKRKKEKIVREVGFGPQNHFYRDMIEAIDCLTQTELSSPKPTKADPKALHIGHWQAIPIPEIMKLEVEPNTPKAFALEMLERFKNKWLTTPTHYSCIRQGELLFLCLGPVTKQTSFEIEVPEEVLG